MIRPAMATIMTMAAAIITMTMRSAMDAPSCDLATAADADSARPKRF